MKVLHLIKTLYVGGAELHLLILCQQLKRLGMEIIVAYLHDPIEWGSSRLHTAFERAGIRIVNLRGGAFCDARPINRLVSLLKEERPDILHTHLPRADVAGAIVDLIGPPVPWVCSVHNIYSRWWSGQRALPVWRLIWRRAEAVIAISHAVKDWLAQDMRLSPEKVVVIHYGIDADRFAGVNSDLEGESVVASKAVIGSAGRLEERKGHDCLIRAMPAILQEIPTASLLIAGNDPWGYGRTLQALIAELKLDAHVQLVGFQDDVPSFLNRVDVFAFASHMEGFGQVIVEAMAAAKPVVASRIAPISEIVQDGQTGLLAEPGNPRDFADAITWLLRHPEEARGMGERGRTRVQNYFSPERMAAETLLLYQRLARAAR